MISTTVGFINWAPGSYPSLVDSNGWSIYELPANNFPWGIQASDEYIWFVDSGRKVLAQIPLTLEQFIYLPLVTR
jgi:hypothetical protein